MPPETHCWQEITLQDGNYNNGSRRAADRVPFPLSDPEGRCCPQTRFDMQHQFYVPFRQCDSIHAIDVQAAFLKLKCLLD